MSPVVVLITRISTARYASLDLPPRPMPLNDRPPPVLEVFSSYAVTVPVTRYCAPVSLPIFAPVLGATRPDAARFCSSSTFCSLLRSTTRKSPLDDSSFESMPDSSQPTPPRHQEARSEERRVGKECRSRWWPDHEKKKVGRDFATSARELFHRAAAIPARHRRERCPT